MIVGERPPAPRLAKDGTVDVENGVEDSDIALVEFTAVAPTDSAIYGFRPVTGVTEFEETIVSVGVDGPLFQLPAGEVSAFFGAEWRDSSIDDTPGLDSQLGNTYNYSTSAITRGSDSVWEAFGEVEVPVLRDHDESVIGWYDETGAPMTDETWAQDERRTLQLHLAGEPAALIVVHGGLAEAAVTLPDVGPLRLRWDSAWERPQAADSGPADRERIWDRALARAPRDGLDLGFVAAQFDLTGGSIRNAALTAAFAAAERWLAGLRTGTPA